MLKEKGIVTKVEQGVAWVNTQSKLVCSSCRVESTCGNGILEKYLAGKVFISKINNELGAKVGDQVTIGVPKVSVNKASFVLYWLPLVCLFVGAWLGHITGSSEIASIIGCLLGLFFGIALAAFYTRKSQQLKQYIPKMIDKKPSQTDFSLKEVELGLINVRNLS